MYIQTVPQKFGNIFQLIVRLLNCLNLKLGNFVALPIKLKQMNSMGILN